MTAAALLVAVAAPAAVSAADSKDSCGRQVFDDWWDNYRIDHVYELHCYRDAIDVLPVDIREYSDAEDDILRAMAYAQQGKPDPGRDGSSLSPSSRTTPPAGNQPKTDQPVQTSRPVETAGPSAIPVPLIVLSAVAGALVLLGAAGYLKRRVADRRDEPGAG